MSTTSDFIGCEVSVEVSGGLGWYQGRVVSVSDQKQTITLTRVLHNGRPAALSEVTLNARDIKDLKLLSNTDATSSEDPKPRYLASSPHEPDEAVTSRIQEQTSKSIISHPLLNYDHSGDHQTFNSVSVNHSQSQYHGESHKNRPFRTVKQQQYETEGLSDNQHGRPKPRASVGQALARGSHSPLYRDHMCDYPRMNSLSLASHDYSSPRRIDKSEVTRTPSKKERIRRRDETTFGTPIDDDMLTTDFDFEKNLALFDKQAVIEEIQNLKPDVVRQADRFSEKKYRCDENVLPAKSPPKRQIIVPTEDAGEVIYANDSGLLVPSVNKELRAALLSTANQHGLTNSRQLEIIGRSATEVILTLSGGSHRLEPGNSHQPPVVVILCGVHMQGAAGVNAARQLESHGVQTIVVTPHLPTSPPPPLLLTHELQLYNLTNGRTTTDPRGITTTFDLIVDARLDHNGRVGEGNIGQSWLNSTSTWASNFRAPILALDPPSDLAAIPSSQPPLPARILLCPALPLAYSPGRGRVYLLNLPIPQQTYSAVGIKYVSPFGAKLVIPLHPHE
ncbi:enhancer of mRNA decapping [Halocaridina rubra]|uniref:Enhancer of mRNA-decapping protein 3 n=1 Tax=Halocaridina rubra TaxID=373956 RepID=A0AAN8XNU8_HALRR